MSTFEDRVAANLAEARRLAESADPEKAAIGRAVRDLSTALARWYANEVAAGSEPAHTAVALNLVLGHGLAAFITSNRKPELPAEALLDFHLASIGQAARNALVENGVASPADRR